jgi:hypothetical protein
MVTGVQKTFDFGVLGTYTIGADNAGRWTYDLQKKEHDSSSKWETG